ncbi:hypothetical protein F4780DRAFT_783841 [Xylariomycetidae sp. FL0641]|nr:hypothetical protein F4780DRAFT_783841 [Xylariomycetidae sp. FL0641]
MRFASSIYIFLRCAGDALAAVTPDAIVQTLNLFESDAEALQKPASKVSAADVILLPLGKGPLNEVVQGFSDALIIGAGVSEQLNGTAPITDADDADAVLAAYGGFARAHEELFDILARNAGLFQLMPNKVRVGKPVYTALSSVKALIDGVSGFLVNTIKVTNVTSEITVQQAEIDDSVEQAIKKYEGRCADPCT